MSEAARRPEPGAITRGLAARAVERVLSAGSTLDAAFASGDVDGLSSSDRAQIKALAFGALRWHHRHRKLLELLLHQPLPPGGKLLEALLSVGMFQLLDERHPDYAAVSATVEAARWLGHPRAASLVNATLRRLQREREELLSRALLSEEGRYSHPAWLIDQLKRDWPEDWERTLQSAQQPPPLWLRVNRMKRSVVQFSEMLAGAGLGGDASPDLPDAVRLQRPAPVAEIPGFAAGEVSVQDAASQLAALLLAPAPGMRVLDACAAPGGKATHLLELSGGRVELLALDIDAARLGRVRDNLLRLGLKAVTAAGDALRPEEWWDRQPFDRILVDAPCSGTGVIRRHPDIKCLRRESDIGELAARQLELLNSLWPLLKSGGRMLYVTCSILQAENTAVVRRFLERCPEACLVEPAGGTLPSWARAQRGGGWQSLPGPADTDGLYYALMSRQPAPETRSR